MKEKAHIKGLRPTLLRLITISMVSVTILSTLPIFTPPAKAKPRARALDHGAWFENVFVGGYMSNIQDGVYIKVEYAPDANTINDDFIRHNPDGTIFWHRTQIKTNVTVYVNFEKTYWGTANVKYIAPDRPIFKSNPVGPAETSIIGKVNDKEGNVYNLRAKVVISANNEIIHWYISICQLCRMK